MKSCIVQKREITKGTRGLRYDSLVGHQERYEEQRNECKVYGERNMDEVVDSAKDVLILQG